MKKIQKFLSIIVLILSISMITPSALPAFPQSVTAEAATIKISKSNVTLIKGQTMTLKITGTKSIIKWSTSKSSTAAVSKKGKVTAKKPGTATITAKVGKKTLKCKVKVESPSISKTSLKLNIGKKYTLKVNGNTQKIHWSSSKKSIATVSSKGTITAKSAGNCNIYATVGGVKYNCKLTVAESSVLQEYVYLSATGSKYHSIADCGNMNPDNARKITKQEAIDSGYTACSKCW